ncbi:MAG: hypothetical protein AB2L18_00330 [Anaerolineaceae bacterium]
MTRKRVLVIGAGASIQECLESGNYPQDKSKIFPSINNFCRKLFIPISPALNKGLALYLDEFNIDYDMRFLYKKSYCSDDLLKSPVTVFQQKEFEDFLTFNIEKLCEFLWNKIGDNEIFWDAFIYDGIYFNLFELFTEQFGMSGSKEFNASKKIINVLYENDLVINLNYDIIFDQALVQNRKEFCYLPQNIKNKILLMKPHGSFNLNVDKKESKFVFLQPDKIIGNVLIKTPQGGYENPYISILPPRLNKTYKQHPIASQIVNSIDDFETEILTFWGIGLTQSDIELTSIYKKASEYAKKIEFINPDISAFENAEKILQKKIIHYKSLDHWNKDN